MTVYIVIDSSYDGWQIMGVFTSRQYAVNYIEDYNSKQHSDWSPKRLNVNGIEEMTLNVGVQ